MWMMATPSSWPHMKGQKAVSIIAAGSDKLLQSSGSWSIIFGSGVVIRSKKFEKYVPMLIFVGSRPLSRRRSARFGALRSGRWFPVNIYSRLISKERKTFSGGPVEAWVGMIL